MTTDATTIDLGKRPAGAPAYRYAFEHLKQLEPGEERTLLSPEDPQSVLLQVGSLMQQELTWSSREQSDGSFCVRVRRRTAEETGIGELLVADHMRLDALLVQALSLARDGRPQSAAPLLREGFGALRRHIRAEGEVLLKIFGPVRDSQGNVTALISREHEDIQRQAAELERLLQEPQPDAIEVASRLIRFAALLTRHEHEEETRLFPIWEEQRRRHADPAGVLAQVRAVLGNHTQA
jgi:uncharacterized protein (DUF2249 family)